MTGACTSTWKHTSVQQYNIPAGKPSSHNFCTWSAYPAGNVSKTSYVGKLHVTTWNRLSPNTVDFGLIIGTTYL